MIDVQPLVLSCNSCGLCHDFRYLCKPQSFQMVYLRLLIALSDGLYKQTVLFTFTCSQKGSFNDDHVAGRASLVISSSRLLGKLRSSLDVRITRLALTPCVVCSKYSDSIFGYFHPVLRRCNCDRFYMDCPRSQHHPLTRDQILGELQTIRSSSLALTRSASSSSRILSGRGYAQLEDTLDLSIVRY